MRQQDAELSRLFTRISFLEDEYKSAKAATDICKEQMNSAWESLHNIQEKYRELKEMADEEFRTAEYCWEMNDRASAKVHSINGRDYNDQKIYIRSELDRLHVCFDSSKSAFDSAKAHQADVLSQLKEARSAKNKRLDELKAQKAAEDAHWHEKNCQKCGKTIRYRDDWSHIPNYCKECREKFDNEKKQREQLRREKSCRGCGKTIIYYADWKHIPNYCEDCRKNGNTWSSRTSKKIPPQKNTHNILDYTHGIKKQNSKDLSEGIYGTHKWYDPHTGQMGEAGPNYPGKIRKPRYD